MAEEGPRLEDLERSVRSLLLSREAEPFAGVPEEAQRIYRRLVRTTLYGVVKNAIPITRGLLGDDATDKLLARWLEEAPPTTRILRAVPEGFAAFCQSLEDPPHPALPELVHFEALELEVLHAPDPDPEVAYPKTPVDEARVEAHPSARLAVYSYPVHGMAKGATAWPKPAREPAFLVAHREGERMLWLTVPRLVAQVLLHTGEGLTLGAAFAALDEQAGESVDRAFARSWLVNLRHRGALLGFPRVTEDPSS